MLPDLKPGVSYTVNGDPVTFIQLETKGARVIPQTEHNPVEGEPIKVKLVNPTELHPLPPKK